MELVLILYCWKYGWTKSMPVEPYALTGNFFHGILNHI